MLEKNIGNDWDALLASEFSKDYFQRLTAFLDNEYENETVYPPKGKVFEALRLTPYAETKVVILGQDPYHEPGQAHGLAFSVPEGIDYPPSLVNIFREASEDVGCAKNHVENINGNAQCADADRTKGILDDWAKQGVLLLNTVLTVRAHEAGSHRAQGWEEFTDRVIELLAERQEPMVFVLWGAPAGKKKELILEAAKRSGTKHLIITAPHPSPLSAYRGFFGGRYFSRANYFLEDNGKTTIKW